MSPSSGVEQILACAANVYSDIIIEYGVERAKIQGDCSWLAFVEPLIEFKYIQICNTIFNQGFPPKKLSNPECLNWIEKLYDQL